MTVLGKETPANSVPAVGNTEGVSVVRNYWA